MYRRACGELRENANGNTALIFAISAASLAMAVGAGIELSRISQVKEKVQGALDASALTAAKLGQTASEQDKKNAAKSSFNLNIATIQGVVANSQVLTQDYTEAGKVKLYASINVDTILPVGIFGAFTKVNVASEAIEATTTSQNNNCVQPTSTIVSITSSSVFKNGDACLISTDTTQSTGMLFNSGVNINAPTCNFHDHSTGTTASIWNRGSVVSLANLFVKGGILNNAAANPNFKPYTADSNMVSDPYTTGLPQPTGTSCTHNNLNFNGDAQLTPGTYCGWINFNKANAIVSMAPGLYIIRGGGWNLNSSQVTANGVTIFFEDNSGFALNSTASLNITAPNSGAYSGIAMYEKYGLSYSQRPFDASRGIKLNGLVYFPTKELVFNSGNGLQSVNTQIVGKRFIFNNINWSLSAYKAPPAAAANLGGILTNGSAELAAISTGTIATPTSVSGWSTTGGFIIHNSKTETGFGDYGTDGNQYFKLNKDLSQTATTIKDKTYEFSFDYKYGENGNAVDNKFEVLLNGNLLATIAPVSNEPWKRTTLTFKAQNSSSVISFRQVSGATTSNGAFIDRVVVSQNDSAIAPADGCPGGKPVIAQQIRLAK